jgi:hypothetical protein
MMIYVCAISPPSIPTDFLVDWILGITHGHPVFGQRNGQMCIAFDDFVDLCGLHN